jgi:hypothetical protein
MAGTTLKKKENITDILRNILEQATRTRRGFTPEVVGEFYEEGLRAQQRREQGRRAELREATPSRQLGNMVATRRSEEAERQRAQISPHMRQRGIEEAVDLGERLELAAQGRPLSLREWIERRPAGTG